MGISQPGRNISRQCGWRAWLRRRESRSCAPDGDERGYLAKRARRGHRESHLTVAKGGGAGRIDTPYSQRHPIHCQGFGIHFIDAAGRTTARPGPSLAVELLADFDVPVSNVIVPAKWLLRSSRCSTRACLCRFRTREMGKPRNWRRTASVHTLRFGPPQPVRRVFLITQFVEARDFKRLAPGRVEIDPAEAGERTFGHGVRAFENVDALGA